jgi:hypothetical protein
MILDIFIKFCILLSILVAVFFIRHYIRAKKAYKKLTDFNDCPFPFEVELDDYRDYVKFDLQDVDLYCEYTFGVRPDGVFGVKELILKGLNGYSGRYINLTIGQSVFPIMLKIDEFQEWARSKIFHVTWEPDFSNNWQSIVNGIDNLRFLEMKEKQRKDKEKEKKNKRSK